MRAILYTRVSTEEQAKEGHGLAAQLRAITLYCEAMSYEFVCHLSDEGVSTRHKLENRPKLWEALQRVQAQEADIIVAQAVDRFSRNTVEYLGLIEVGAPLLAMDLGLNPKTAMGRFVATLLVARGQLERDLTGERTTAALAVLRDRGVPLGSRSHRNPVVVPDQVRERIQGLRDTRMSLRKIAATLTAEEIKTPRGEHSWSHSTVQGVLASM